MNKILLWLVCLIIWIYFLRLFRKEKLTAFHFMLGATGFFCLVYTMFKRVLVIFCTSVLELLLDGLSHIFSFYEIYKEYNIIFINHDMAAISLFIDYECCGLIEILVVFSVILFFPLFTGRQKFRYVLIGYVYTVFANLIRLLCVIGIIYRYGNNVYYLAHSVFGRVVFYVLTLLFYFYMITWKQIKTQKLGSFGYDDDNRVEKEKNA